MKKLSIITINYNNCDGLKKTIESVIEQTYTDYEYIIIDGGSTDGSLDVIKEYNKKIDYWVSEPDRGIYNAMNKGILKATGEYCNFMNSGDFFYNKNVLEKVLPHLQEDIILGKYKKESYPYGIGHQSDLITMLDLFKGSFNHQSAFIKRSLFEKELYNEEYKVVSDWKFFLDVLVFKNCSFKNINIIIANYDMTGFSSNSKDLYLSERDTILKEALPERIYMDYIRYSEADSPLLELTPILNKTYGFNKFIYHLDSFLIKIYTIIKKIKHRFLFFL